VVIKSERKLYAYSDGTLVKTYTISLGRKPEGKKRFKGDYRTPEGIFTIDSKNSRSECYKNLGISYTNQIGLEYAEAHGHSSGGSVKIHGLQNGLGIIGRLHRLMDWTAGCIALTNDEIDELYDAVKIGSPIEIKP
jgi:murein L,D-transpeptidase YafK